MRLLILWIIVAITFISSCTIQKRTFRKGYYVSWINARNRCVKDQGSNTRNVDAILSADKVEEKEEEPVVLQDSIPQEKNPEPAIFPDTASSQVKASFFPKSNQEQESVIEKASKEVKTKKPQDLELEHSPKKKLNFFALGSFGLSLVYAGLLLLSISMNLSESIAAIAILFLFAAIACAVIAFVIARRNRGSYWGTFFAVFALVIVLAATIASFAHLIAISV